MAKYEDEREYACWYCGWWCDTPGEMDQHYDARHAGYAKPDPLVWKPDPNEDNPDLGEWVNRPLTPAEAEAMFAATDEARAMREE